MATEDEQRIAHEILMAVRRLQLPLKLDEITEGRGNCFPLSVLAQCRRLEIFQKLSFHTQNLIQQGNPTLLRRAVHLFMENSQSRRIQEYKRTYQEILSALDNKTWREYWDVMVRNYEWVDYIFIQSAAWFLGHDILIVTTTSTEGHPYITISGNLIDEYIPCPGIPLTIGSKPNVHYQSLLPVEVRVPRKRIEPSLPENTINLKVSELKSSDQARFPKLESKGEFPDLIFSKDRKQSQPTTLKRRSARQTNPINMNSNREQNNLKPDPPPNDIESHQKCNENKTFKYRQESSILNFQFMTDKRVKCPTCQKEFKNILRHLQQSGCRISNLVDFSAQFKEFSESHFENQIKDGRKKRQAKWLAKQREHDEKQVKDDQKRWKTKFMDKLREDNDQKAKNDQTKRKAKSRAKQREDDDQQAKNDQNKWKAKARANQREDDD